MSYLYVDALSPAPLPNTKAGWSILFQIIILPKPVSVLPPTPQRYGNNSYPWHVIVENNNNSSGVIIWWCGFYVVPLC